MIFVGIDVAKNKHDCFIISSEKVLDDVFTISNSKNIFFKQSMPVQVLAV